MNAAKAEGEKMWHMPLDDDYKELLKSAFADLANIGGRWEEPSARRGSCASSSTIRRGFTWISPGRPGWMTRTVYGEGSNRHLRTDVHEARDELVAEIAWDLAESAAARKCQTVLSYAANSGATLTRWVHCTGRMS